jgi:membrane-associated phospholipid phosphatase
VERAALTLGVLALFVAGYFGVGRNIDPARARELATSLDGRIPFIARSVWVYLWVFPASLLPLFLVRCPRLFRRAMLSYGIAIVVSLAVFAAMPVTSIGLRMDRSTLDVTHASPWAVSVLYAVDPPLNLFPSLHLSIAMLASLAAGKARRSYGAAAFVGVVLVAASICTVKQHFVLDGLGGAALAAVIYAAVLRPYRPDPGIDPAYGWPGPAAYTALLAVLYGGLYLGFRLACGGGGTSPSRFTNVIR